VERDAHIISNTKIKKKDGMLVTLCGGKSELMAKRKSVHICLGKVEFEQVSSTQSRRRTEDGNLIKLSGGRDELELVINKRGVSISLEQQEIAQIHTFYDCCVQKQYFRYTCPCQVAVHEIIYDPEALSYFMRNLIFKGSNSLLARLMD
jgi:hypothetical protein